MLFCIGIKATGFPITKGAAQLIGMTLDEIDNDITQKHQPFRTHVGLRRGKNPR